MCVRNKGVEKKVRGEKGGGKQGQGKQVGGKEEIENKTRHREIALMLHVRVDSSTATWTKLSHYLA